MECLASALIIGFVKQKVLVWITVGQDQICIAVHREGLHGTLAVLLQQAFGQTRYVYNA